MKKGDIVPFGRPPPPKRIKRGHLSSDYRQKCVNATRDILMSKARGSGNLTCRLQTKVIRGTGRVLGGTGGPNQANLEA